jgi:hypothetical protein
MARRNQAKMLRCSHSTQAAKKQPTQRTPKPLTTEEKAWAYYMNEARRNAKEDSIAPVELQRARVYMGTATQYVEPTYTKDRNYQHGPLPNVPKSQRLWT